VFNAALSEVAALYAFVKSPAVVIIGQVKLGIVLAPEVCATILWQGRPVR
jgi:hypothetical protein